MLTYSKDNLKHNVQTIVANPELFISDLAKRKQYQIAKDMGLTSTQMSFLISIFWALADAPLSISTKVQDSKGVTNVG